MPTRPDTPTPPAALRLVARLGLLLWAGFWTWFMVSVMASEGIALEPVAMLSGLCTVTVLAWFRPRLGAVALVALSAWSLWCFRNGAAIWLIALPACAIAALAWLGAPSRRGQARPPKPA
jgi:hypothetical protein